MTHFCSATSQPNRSVQHTYCARCRRSSGLGVDQDLESAVDHAREFEGHGFLITHRRDARVLHDLGVDAIAMRARLEHNPREHDGLAWLSLGRSRDRHPELDLEIVTCTLSVFERAMFAPNLTRLLGHAAVGYQVFFGTGKTYPSTYRM